MIFNFSLFLLVVCGIVAYLIWRGMKKTERQAQNTSGQTASSTDLRIENAGPGAVLHLRNIGPDMEEFDVQVVARHTYRQNGYKWHELECDKGTEKIWLELEQDDELEITVGLQKMKLDDVGLKPEDLKRMEDSEEGILSFAGAKYELEETGQAFFYRNREEQNAESFTFWDFESDAADNYIGIEKWSDNTITVTLSQPVHPSQISVFSVK